MDSFEFAKELFKINEYASIAENGIVAGDVCGFIDSGSYVVNALLSGSIYGGYPRGKVTALAGQPATGKTFFVLTAIKEHLSKDPKSIAVLFESESALSKKLLEDFKIDVSRVLVLPVETIEGFRYQCLKILSNYGEQQPEDRRDMMIVLDSLGMLSTEKEIADISDGKSTRDMTRAQMVKGAFRVLTLKLGKLGIPLLLTNHVYQEMGLFPKTIMSGGSGVQFAASTIMFLSKKKDKLGNDFVGNVIHCKLDKGRITREGSLLDTLINFETGLSRWYGMVDLALDAGIWKKAGSRIELRDGSKIYAKNIMESVDKYFTDDIMKEIDEFCEKKFKYGNATIENTGCLCDGSCGDDCSCQKEEEEDV